MHTQICTTLPEWQRADVRHDCTAVAVCACCGQEVASDQDCVVCRRFVCMTCDSVREPTPYKCESCRAAGSTIMMPPTQSSRA